MKNQIIVSVSSILFILIVTAGIILYGKGYRITLGGGKAGFSGTGLLVAKSQPDGAQIFINNHLTTATNNTISLSPDEYDIKIVKQGYFPWEKRIIVKKEVVSKIDALLLTTTPKLESITDSGVTNPVIDPSNTQIAFTVKSSSIRKNGIYVLNTTSRPILTLQSASTQIADDTEDSFSQSSLAWSPDGKQLLAIISGENGNATYLLDATSFNQSPKDVTEILTSVTSLWEKQKLDREKSRIEGLKSNLKKAIAEDFKIISWSPDETKILYTASQSATIPIIIKPSLIGTNSTPETRTLQKNSVYIYDIEEDKNFEISDSLPVSQSPLSWLPDSKHLIFVKNQQIDIMEYDGKNKTTIYAGPFIDNYVFPWPDGTKILVLTNLGNSNTPPNLYTIGLK